MFSDHTTCTEKMLTQSGLEENFQLYIFPMEALFITTHQSIVPSNENAASLDLY